MDNGSDFEFFWLSKVLEYKTQQVRTSTKAYILPNLLYVYMSAQ